MIPQRKEQPPHDPWAHVEQRRQPPANDPSFGRTSKGNWPMLFAAICGIGGAAVVIGVALWHIGSAIWKYRAGLLGSIAAAPWFWSMGALAAVGLVLSFVGVRWLRERRERHEAMQRYLETTIPGAAK